VERDSGIDFLVHVPDRSEKTLIALIEKWIEPGSVLINLNGIDL